MVGFLATLIFYFIAGTRSINRRRQWSQLYKVIIEEVQNNPGARPDRDKIEITRPGGHVVGTETLLLRFLFFKPLKYVYWIYTCVSYNKYIYICTYTLLYVLYYMYTVCTEYKRHWGHFNKSVGEGWRRN